MSDVKFKGTTKYKAHEKCKFSRKDLCDEVMVSSETKVGYRDYMNEVFAGLIWLG